MGVKYFNRTWYKNVEEICKVLSQEFQAIWDVLDSTHTEDHLYSDIQSYSPTLDAGDDFVYTGYFALQRIDNDDGTWNVKISDNSGGNSLASICSVNGKLFSVKPWVSKDYTDRSSTFYIYLRYTYTGNGQGVVDIIDTYNKSDQSILENDNTHAYYLLGRCHGDRQIQQDHMSGIPQIIWFSHCEV